MCVCSIDLIGVYACTLSVNPKVPAQHVGSCAYIGFTSSAWLFWNSTETRTLTLGRDLMFSPSLPLRVPWNHQLSFIALPDQEQVLEAVRSNPKTLERNRLICHERDSHPVTYHIVQTLSPTDLSKGFVALLRAFSRLQNLTVSSPRPSSTSFDHLKYLGINAPASGNF